MLRIFRKLRLSLLGELGTRKYLLYAAGEVFLIVVGVMFALQLNNWNNLRIMRIQEKVILVRLNEELENSLGRISLFERAVQRKEEALIEIGPFLNGKPIEDERAFLEKVVSASAFGWEQPVMEQTTFEEILSSGKLSLIRDINLRLSITRFFHTTKQREHRSDVRITEFPKITYKYIPLTQQIRLLTDLSDQQTADIVSEILQSDLKDYVLPELNRARFILSIWDQTKEEGNALLEQILTVRGVEGVRTDMEAMSERRAAARNEREPNSSDEILEERLGLRRNQETKDER